ncbi:hypothetical protein EHS25_003813 [Saitozyma podzolica]|uniref:Uncharacterized protein n=1 Tax=Saitozyma podzolica TaxID=1890683 RepID=A0A427Y3L7_9TREE|nr:hypothetical protein EHS25_003813 [Saitozyma podzolica]
MRNHRPDLSISTTRIPDQGHAHAQANATPRSSAAAESESDSSRSTVPSTSILAVLSSQSSQFHDTEFTYWRDRRIMRCGNGSWPCDAIELQVGPPRAPHRTGPFSVRIPAVPSFVRGTISSGSVDYRGAAESDPFLGPVYEVLRRPTTTQLPRPPRPQRVLDIATGTGT